MQFRRRNAPGTGEGFTLIELLIVIVIIAILAGLALVGVNYAIRSSKRSSTEAMLNAISGQVENYKQSWGDYPPTYLADVVDSKNKKGYSSNGVNEGCEALVACLSSTKKGGVPMYRVQDDGFLINTDGDSSSANLATWYFGDNQLREYADHFGSPVIYIHHRDYQKVKGGGMKYNSGAGQVVAISPGYSEKEKNFRNPFGYQLFSPGPDQVPGNEDDIIVK